MWVSEHTDPRIVRRFTVLKKLMFEPDVQPGKEGWVESEFREERDHHVRAFSIRLDYRPQHTITVWPSEIRVEPMTRRD